ncbi:hypothetical protein EUGRSUZ_J01550 [Eucalyptus grandis]|uniref:Uncharacterized protein n=2 Tax=Eucalyptus grandis TaxID=71139 RepID=A0ACC3J5N9_EUCGR|nr:hypothetical protein EUGRSUZ_J01550 [Eucalyptus grandis]
MLGRSSLTVTISGISSSSLESRIALDEIVSRKELSRIHASSVCSVLCRMGEGKQPKIGSEMVDSRRLVFF